MKRGSSLRPHRAPVRRIRVPVAPVKLLFLLFVAAFFYVMVRFQELDFKEDDGGDLLTHEIMGPGNDITQPQGQPEDGPAEARAEHGAATMDSLSPTKEKRQPTKAIKRKPRSRKKERLIQPQEPLAEDNGPSQTEAWSDTKASGQGNSDVAEAAAAQVHMDEVAVQGEEDIDHHHQQQQQQSPPSEGQPEQHRPVEGEQQPQLPPQEGAEGRVEGKEEPKADASKDSNRSAQEQAAAKEEPDGDEADDPEEPHGDEKQNKPSTSRKEAAEMERQKHAEQLLAQEMDPTFRAMAYKMRLRELELAEAERSAEEVFAPVVTSIHPTHGPRAGGTVLLVRGSGFGRRTDEIAVVIGGVPCEQTRWLSPETVSCLTPEGSGTDLEVTVAPCVCGDDQPGRAAGGGPAAQVAGAVFSYVEDALKEFLDREPIMDVRPQGLALQLNRNQLVNNSDGAMFEARFFNYETGSEDFYSIMPAMVQVLPVEDKPRAYKTCAVVGKSGSLIGSKLGPSIDSHDAVFRFDNSPTAFKFATDVGRRTRYQVINAHWGNSLMSYGTFPDEPQLPRVTRWWIDVAVVVLWGDASQSDFLKLRYIYPNAGVMFLSRDIVTLGNAFSAEMRSRIEKALHLSIDRDVQPSSQLYTLLLAMNMCDQVSVYGFESGCVMRSRRCAHTYYDESNPSEQAKRQMLLDNNIALALAEAGLVNVVKAGRRPPQHAVALSAATPGGLPCCDATMCLPLCSGNGVYSNGTCHCRKMFSGVACELDHLDLNSKQLIDGIDLVYSDDILLHQGAVEWLEPAEVARLNVAAGSTGLELGVVPVPPGIINNKTEIGDYFVVDQRTFDFLPEQDAALFANWLRTHSVRDSKHESRRSMRRPGLGTCALVGNSGQLLSHQYGLSIDDHDVIYRFNQAPVAGFKGEVGSRCTHEGLNSAWVKLLVEGKHGDGVFGQHRSWDWRGDETAIMLFEMFDPTAYQQKNKESILQKEQWWKKSYQKLRARHPDRKVWVMSPKFVAWAFQLYQEFEDRFENLGFGTFRGEKPMSGYYAIMYALQVCSEVDVYGFTPYQETDAGDPLVPRYHYFDEAVPRHNSHSFDLTQNMYRLLARNLPYFRIFD